jgi:hypothetical protein
MTTGTQTKTVWTLWIRDLDETLETCLAEVKHQGELKLWHPEPLACARLLHTMIHRKNRQATTTTLPLPAALPACQADTTQASQTTTHWLSPTTGGLQHHQMPAPNLPRRCRRTGLDAKGVTPKLLRLNF